MEKALVLDPMSPFTSAQSGWMRLRHGDYEESIRMFHKSIEFSPSLVIGHMLLGHASIMVSRFDEAIAALQEAVRLSDGDAWMKGSLAYAYAASGRKDLAAGLLRELREDVPASGYRRSFPIALAYAGLGDKDRAFEFLDKAYEERDSLLANLGEDHLFNQLRSDPRWPAVIRKIGLVPENVP
jgi:tetratricopeptide (TPR) repeat protein